MVSIEIPEAARRTPLVLVHVAVGPLTVAVGVVLPRSGWLEARPPLSVLGGPAVATDPPGLWAEIEEAAIAAARDDPAAQRHLQGHRTRRFKINCGELEPAPIPRLEGADHGRS